MNLYQLEAPASPTGLAISLEKAKLQCRVTSDDENWLISDYVAASQAAVESVTGRALTRQRWRLSLLQFPSGLKAIEIPRPPLISIETFTYINELGVVQSLVEKTDYYLDSDAEPARIYPAATGWPNTHSYQRPAVVVEYTCGHEVSGRPMPPWAAQVVRTLIGYCYENRELVVTGTIATELPKLWAILINHKVIADFDQ